MRLTLPSFCSTIVKIPDAMLYLQIRNCLFDFAHNKDVIPQESFLNPKQVQILKKILPE
jgi:hypothetical protein